MTKPLSDLDGRRSHDIGDFCERLLGECAARTALVGKSEPFRLGPSGDHRLSQGEKK